ncbi:copper chaperone PCu(A)C [Marinomonas mediterranea]|uniref:copper chaperone PCu(A)C n=1 Tax=Marinomonas mediterranea TaxID=119864 RepID=UPI00234B0A21|nr:copper chaperone PCu(A)C [Marinomonas mediterranea]WCN07571.1 copper chaperone PCu(A)C [Marinomonas mediterranea]
MIRMISRAALLIASVSASFAMAASLNFEHLQVRATPPGASNSGGYMVVENPSNQYHVLVAVESDIAKSIELHTHEMKDGVMSMHKVKDIVVPAGGQVVFQPGGYHIMIMGLHYTLKVGDMVHFTMILKNGEKIAVHAPVVAPEDIKQHDNKMHMGSSDSMHKKHMKMDDETEHH